MLGTEERLFEQYKKVDNICRDMFSSQKGISQYITEMEQQSFHGRSTVPLWDEYYRKLKHIRWLRNQIAHESYTTDCDENDVVWLKEFHHQLLECKDPLALLEKANRELLDSPSQCKHKPNTDEKQRLNNNTQMPKQKDTSLKWITTLFIGAAVIAVFIIFYLFIAI